MSIRLFIGVLASIVTPAMAQQAPAPVSNAPLSLDLICTGRGTLHTTQKVPDGRDKEGRKRTRSQSVDEPFGGALRFRIRDAVAEALPPEPMLSQVGVGGWRPVKKLATTDATITGKIDLGFLYAPVFEIDRYAGTISISGSMNTFQGECQPYDGSQRQF
ncbi:hypothetical protein SAMN05216382_2805 [Sphingomonas palmae]|uniref:Uncharacterized protein n=2 Tax=Sphingomonas palmae TaxID=1855283 RepID=A0A1H7TTA1_9SPHN|nr:hypothetical protein SAMN05216382_2805 [Sphingomonas palmae]